ncbi:cytidine deaminase-like protein [Russula aff. rugulosa BPL654]|nr:cytidine deaminase-like protein [Russula aff. rugulosa BPL654]
MAHTILDHYTFKWRDGRMALALGLGSLFNHSDSPNVSYSIDTATESIRYTTARAVDPDEELCIHYGSNLWFKPAEIPISDERSRIDTELVEEDGWGGLSAVAGEASSSKRILEDMPNPNEILPMRTSRSPGSNLLLMRTTKRHQRRSVQAWAVDIPDPRHTTSALKWVKSSGLDTPTLSHLKRVRKSPTGTHSTLLLTSTSPTVPELPPILDLAPPYQLSVPRSAALTPTSLALKNALWPTVFAPRRKGEPEDWSRARAQWACTAMLRVVKEARAARAAGELPIASYVPSPPEEPAWPSYLARDTRISSAHPLRHAALNVVRALADSTTSTSASTTPAAASAAPTPSPPASTLAPAKNGQQYLLTSRALFTTHEPCVMCSMALLHSRVKEVFFLVPMQRTGGCGGAVCVPKLDGVNHRFAIGRWKTGAGGVSVEGLEIDENTDS